MRRWPEPRASSPSAAVSALPCADDSEQHRSQRLFDRAAPHYERVHRVMTLGIGGLYRWWALSRAGLRAGMRVLDVGTGTGAMARAAARLVGSSGRVTGIDPSPGMLREATRRHAMAMTRGIAEALPFRDAAFDAVSMGYALRYLADLPATLAECLRVLRPGGRLVVVELVRPASRAGRRVARFYLDTAVPWMSGARPDEGDVRPLMRHCWATIERSVPGETVRDAILDAGFEQLRTTLWFGFVREQVASKPCSVSPDATWLPGRPGERVNVPAPARAARADGRSSRGYWAGISPQNT